MRQLCFTSASVRILQDVLFVIHPAVDRATVVDAPVVVGHGKAVDIPGNEEQRRPVRAVFRFAQELEANAVAFVGWPNLKSLITRVPESTLSRSHH